MYQNMGFLLKIQLQNESLLIDTSTEEFYPVYENGIYNNSFSCHFVAGIFLMYKNAGFILKIYFAEENSSD